MRVIATAGHVDHGKSTLVRALTGMEPDRWAEERRRGMTIDLGYAWTELPSGEMLAFVDVPGHVRFIGNMLAGLGPAPAVLFVVAADEGWRRQSSEHLAAVDALGLSVGVLAVTRSDLADPAPATAEALEHLAMSSLGAVDAVAVSGTTGAGLDALRAALDRTVASLPVPDVSGRVRLWVDRSFTVRGSGTVVTGTLGAGTLRVGDELELRGRRLRVRGLQSLGTPYDEVHAVARVAVNLRGIERDEVGRGDALLTPASWRVTDSLDVEVTADVRDLPGDLVLHVGSAGVPARVRPLGDRAARLTLGTPLPLQPGDRALLRDPGGQRVAAGVVVLDGDPPALRRRGAAAARADALSAGPPDLRSEVIRRGAVKASDLLTRGLQVAPTAGVHAVGEWLVSEATWADWGAALVAAVDSHAEKAPLEPGLPDERARQALRLPDQRLPDLRLLAALVRDCGLEQAAGRVRRAGAVPRLGPGVAALEQRLAGAPFSAPEQVELDGLALSRQEIAAAVTSGRLILLTGGIVLLPDGPARAMRLLASLPQPFTASDARQVLGTSRRVAIPLLEHLDARGWTRRVDGALREVVR